MPIKVLIFGQLTEITQSDTLVMDTVADTAALRAALEEKFPALATARFVMAIDNQVVPAPVAISEHTTVALLPPFSGG